MRSPVVPFLEPVLGGLWWIVGAVALNYGLGTVVLAAGIGITGLLIAALRSRYAAGAPLPPGGRGRLVRNGVILVVLVAATGPLLGLVGLTELTVPVACALTGAALFPLASMLDERALLAAGGVLMVLAAAGALWALDSAGPLYPQGVVGLAAGAVLWVVGAQRSGLLAEVRSRR
ncbi:MAG TPA: hypothetical protein VGE11_05870 [Pseudonocardia sp.]